MAEVRTDVDYDSVIPRIAVELPERMGRAEADVAQEIAADAKRRAPRLNRVIVYAGYERYPGQMADSIEVIDEGDQMAVGVGAYWGLFVEKGTEHMNAEPFLQPAAIANEADLVVTVKRHLQQAVSK